MSQISLRFPPLPPTNSTAQDMKSESFLQRCGQQLPPLATVWFKRNKLHTATRIVTLEGALAQARAIALAQNQNAGLRLAQVYHSEGPCYWATFTERKVKV